MSQLQDEIDANRAAFFKGWTAEATKNWTALHKSSVFADSYRRLTSLQSIKASIVNRLYSAESASFFFEAHNDALVSHVSASVGAWRSSLQSLRSCVENVLCAIYYNDHPIELELWNSGEFRIGFSDLIKYAEKHPRLSGLKPRIVGLETLKEEYATLSKAVHGSATKFRMTDPVSNILLWNADPIKASMWSTREKVVVEAVCLLMICLHRTLFEGTGLTPVRNVLYFALSQSSRRLLKTELKITIPTQG